MSAHWPTVYIGKPKEYESLRPLVSSSWTSVGLPMTSLKERSIAKNQVSSAMAGTSVWRTMVERAGSMPAASQSFTISMVSARMSWGLSKRVVKACMLASRK